MIDVTRRAFGRNNVVSCAQCGNVFKPLRRSARFCGDTCRKRASRGMPRAFGVPARAILSVTVRRDIRATIKTIFVTLKKPASLPEGIVPDGNYPGMYRLRLPDGSLSDLVNLTRARDALADVRGRP
jgi:hypothetical protein